ncbi:MAG TPA: trypsin-like peptidase domain-containing protein [Vicinamibacterales bacterium]|nr:trypsin-like peptidase domain-containing protein [Vicinamibacterales bacterium]
MHTRAFSFRPWAAIAVAGCLAASMVGGWTVSVFGQRGSLAARPVPRTVTPRGPLLAGEQATVDLFEKARASVAFISTQARVMDAWTRNVFSVPRGTGSGFIWDADGHIVTNRHVVAGATGGARVRLSDGRDVDARVVGVSPAHDLAVLKVDLTNLPRPLPLGSSVDLRVGQSTFAIGNPFGLDWTLTTGIVSALDRSLPTEDGRSLIEHLIQTDAAINPGNSGGPLLDSAGRLIGVNTVIYSPSGASAGVGFAIPVDTVNRVVPQLIASGRYVRPALGIEIDEGLNQVISQRLGVSGVVILRTSPGSAAAAAGLRGLRTEPGGAIVAGDIIVAINGQAIDSVARLQSRLDDYEVGATVRLTVLRDKQRIEVPVRLQASTQ